MRTFILAITAGLLVAGCQGRSEPSAPPPAQAPPTAAEVPADAPQTSGPTDAGPASEQAPAEGVEAAPSPVPPAPVYREVTVPEGTVLQVRLDTPLASDTSQVEQRVDGTLKRAVVIDGLTALPEGTQLRGTVTEALRSAKVKGRARLAFRFTSVTLDSEAVEVQTATVSREAQATKKKDAKKIGIGTAGGAIVGGIIGGGKGAAIGTAVGAGAGTTAVMTTRGAEVQLAEGTALSVRTTRPLIVRVKVE